MSKFGHDLIESSKEALILVYKERIEQLEALLKETYEMLDYNKNSKRYEECVTKVEEALGITYE